MADTSPNPPRIATWVLARVLHRTDRDCALTDLADEFDERHARDGRRAARAWYWKQTGCSVGPALLRRLAPPSAKQQPSMPFLARTARLRRSLASEWKWAWRGVRGRGAAALLQVGLVAATLAANAVVFSATDAFVFRRVPYPNADRLVTFRGLNPRDPITQTGLSRVEIDAWRSQRDLFSAVHAYDQDGTIYVSNPAGLESVPAERVTPGFFEMLGTTPRWGRQFVDEDAVNGAPPVSIIAESLARRVFGDPAVAIGRMLPAGPDSSRIVGVMPDGFFFPTAVQEIWRPLSFDALARRPYGSFRVFSALALTMPGVTPDRLKTQVAERTAAMVPQTAPGRTGGAPTFRRTAVYVSDALQDPHASLFRMLFGAAGALLLIAALNLASLEVAGAFARARVYAVQGALGATRAMLVRTALLEAAFIAGAGAAIGGVLALGGVAVLRSALPPSLKNGLMAPIAVNWRAAAFMTGACLLTWIVAALPVVWRASRPLLSDALGSDRRVTVLPRRAAIGRQSLTAAQVALTVLLLVGSLLFVHAYVARVREATGFDTKNLAGIQVLPSPAARPAADLARDIAARLRVHPSVISVAETGAILPATGGGISGEMHLVGRPSESVQVGLAFYDVDPDYFRTLNLGLRNGRWLTAADKPGAVVVDAALADRFWPRGDAVGSRFFLGADKPSAGVNKAYVFEIVGVASHARGTPMRLLMPGAESFAVYDLITPSTYAPLNFVVRLDDLRHLGDVAALVRSIAGPSVVRAQSVDDGYAALYGDTRIAAGVTTAFGVLALIVAMVGVYGVMACVVAARTREIGIRIALGARAQDIRRHVLGSSLAFVVTGALAGLAVAVAASHSIASQLFGVQPTDPTTYAAVALVVAATSVAATWRPARRAARVDPAITLRAE